MAASLPSRAQLISTYRRSHDRLTSIGRAAAEAVRARRTTDLYSTLSARFRQALALGALDELLAQLPRLTDWDAETTLPLSGVTGQYGVSWKSPGAGRVDLRAVIGADGLLHGLLIEPGPQVFVPERELESALSLAFPLRGHWIVFAGGTHPIENHHLAVPAQREALDLVRWNDHGVCIHGAVGNESYAAWDQLVHAPADGFVEMAADGIEDNVAGTPAWQQNGRPEGNHVLLKVADRRYVLLAHLRRGSLRVRAGDQLISGQIIAAVGNSGRSSEPHLHIHAQTSPSDTSIGVPLTFTGVQSSAPLAARSLIRGDFLSTAH